MLTKCLKALEFVRMVIVKSKGRCKKYGRRKSRRLSVGVREGGKKREEEAEGEENYLCPTNYG